MRLFTKSDLERCARLAVNYKNENLDLFEVGEAAIYHAVETVTADAAEFYRRSDLERVARSAALLVLQGVEVEEAVRAVAQGVRV